jgi:hypothetical protein
MNEAERFWSKCVPEPNTGCWLWTAAVHARCGYGWVNFRGKPMYTHRAAYLLTHGSIPSGAHILHSCDQKLCVNPAHLRAGTNAENVADARARGLAKDPPHYTGEAHWTRRHPDLVAHGDRSHLAKLTREKVAAIRSAYAANDANQYELADVYGVSQGTIGFIVRGETWKETGRT